MATQLSALTLLSSVAIVAFSTLPCQSAWAQSADFPTAPSVVSSQKRSATTLRAQTAKFDQPGDATDQATMTSDEVLTMSPETANNLMAQAEQALSAGHVNYAIKIARKCVAEDAFDVDAHILLGRALMEKYRNQVDKQPALLKECLEQFLYVARHGEHDSFQSTLAQQKMFDLTGVRWHLWLSQSAYLKKALQGTGLVAGNVVEHAPRDNGQSHSDAAR
jgi:hypothetical protein